MEKHTDVIIIGGGISGLVLSVLLKRKGIDFKLLSRIDKRKSMALSETLPPSTLVLLESLDLLDFFEKNSTRSFGYQSIWGDEKITENNFFYHNPFKYGLKINKEKILDQLSGTVSEHLLNFNIVESIDCSFDKASIDLLTGKKRTSIKGKIVIDATGRNRLLLKSLKIPTIEYDQLIASSCHIPAIKHPQLIHKVFIESFENGWGILSSLNKETNIITLFTQKGNSISKDLKNIKNWQFVLSTTKILKNIIANNLSVKVVGSNANSSKPNRISGTNWLAIGDAAISFDPLSSHGISNAIYTAKAASEAIVSFLNDPSAIHLKNYEKELSIIFQEYLKQKTHLYRTENRWSNSSFWMENQTLLETTS